MCPYPDKLLLLIVSFGLCPSQWWEEAYSVRALISDFIAGTYKAKDCDRPGQAPVCLPCANGTFTAVDNTMSKCFQCTRCRTGELSIELRKKSGSWQVGAWGDGKVSKEAWKNERLIGQKDSVWERIGGSRNKGYQMSTAWDIVCRPFWPFLGSLGDHDASNCNSALSWRWRKRLE